MTTLEPAAVPPGDAARATVGVDLVDVGRLARLAEDPEGLSTLLTQRELAYCMSRRLPAQHIAARFAAKEAVLKAFGTGLSGGIRWLDVEVLRDRGGKPHVALHGRAQDLATERGLRAIEISLAHTRELAVAHAVATWGAPRPSTPPSDPGSSMFRSAFTMADLQQVLVEHVGLPEDEVSADEALSFADAGLDSLAVVEVHLALHQRYGVPVPDDDVLASTTLGDTIDLVNAHLVTSAAQ
jgi:holo-[acyl-carrier protein] synthase